MNKVGVLSKPSIFLRILGQSGASLVTIRGPLSYCQGVFICRSISESQADTDGLPLSHVITRESKVDSSVAQRLEARQGSANEFIKYRGHDGVMRRTRTQVPTRLIKAMKILMEKYPMESVTAKAEQLVKYLTQRQPPLSDQEINDKAVAVERKLLEKDPNKFENLSGADLEDAIDQHRKAVLSRLRKTIYNWKPMNFDAFTSYTYMVGRTSFDFSVIMQCFTEISKRDLDFQPSTVYHYGSKVGACVWAADKTWRSIGEHYCVDSSSHMSTIARLLLQDGNEQETVMSIKGVHFRQFEPSPKENKFSLVVSPFMLIEQPSAEERMNLVLSLWEMTESYLVLIENGTTAGFNLINEAKEFLLNVSQVDGTSRFQGHVFAPCPHDKPCPKLREQKMPCLTECVHKEVDIKSSKLSEKPKKNARYSYVILKKGVREEEEFGWPRVLRQIKAKRHTHCHLCLPCGQLQHVVITKGKFDKHTYGCARYVTQGDRLPLSLSRQPGAVPHEPSEEHIPVDWGEEEPEQSGTGDDGNSDDETTPLQR
ncbi:methyltransferase-like protein 17, mitochondrial [Aplysia californica]|uniref:Methyltransferase-like protein 17, mitochondrial n=1 Tax=Aplysia californica TaxID=6500 RepID=A0ABM0JUW4_APLCA|nr:methyltransferase-like protein 17, mitochondrial [Aplysia californica]